MKLRIFLLLGALMCSTKALPKNRVTTPHFTFEQKLKKDFLKNEKTKWPLLQEMLTSNVDRFTTPQANIGALMKNYATLLSLPVGALATVIYSLIFLPEYGLRTLFSFEKNHDRQMAPTPSLKELGILATIGPAGYLLAYLFIHIVGSLLQTGSETCTNALRIFFCRWDKNRLCVPPSVLPYFERLYTDIDNTTKTFKTLREHDAQRFVENILSASLFITL